MARLFLSHGASGSAAGLAPQIVGLRRRGIDATAVQLPRVNAERAMPVYLAAAPPSGETAIGGHSFGGRVASLIAAEHEYGALVLLSYPLHPPGNADRWDERTAHWPRITCPVLLLSGDRDPFSKVGLLQDAVRRLPAAELIIHRGLGHGIGPVLDDALDEVAAFLKVTVGRRLVHSCPWSPARAAAWSRHPISGSAACVGRSSAPIARRRRSVGR